MATTRNFDRYDSRYELAKATPKGTAFQRKSNKNVTRSLVDTQYTGRFIACATFIKWHGDYDVRRNDKTNRLEIISTSTGERIKFTDVARNYDNRRSHSFQKIIRKYGDGTVYSVWMLMNAGW